LGENLKKFAKVAKNGILGVVFFGYAGNLEAKDATDVIDLFGTPK